MAKAKKVQPTKDEEKNVQDVSNGAKAVPSKEKKLAKPMKKVFGGRATNPSTPEMVISALKSLKNDNGVAMASIRKYMRDNYIGFRKKFSKERLEAIKNFMIAQCEKGSIEMMNSDDTIEVSKRVTRLETRFNIAE